MENLKHNQEEDSNKHAQGNPDEHRGFTIIVNGREKPWGEKHISYEQVVHLAFGATHNPNTIYTVTYKRGLEPNSEGTMVAGDVVRVKNKMIFNATPTDKS